MSYFCIADGASAWFGGYARGDNADCLAAMKALAVIGIVFAILYVMNSNKDETTNDQISPVILVCAASACTVAYGIQAGVYWSPINVYNEPSKRLSTAVFLTQTAPTFVAIYICWTLHRTVVSTNSASIIWGSTWVIGLLMVFGAAIQAVAVGMVVRNKDGRRNYSDINGHPVVGERIWTATLAAQAIALLLLMGNSYQMYKMKPGRMAIDNKRELRTFLLYNIAALFLMFLRTIFRAVSTVIAANNAPQDYSTSSGDDVVANTGEGSTYIHIVWYNFGFDGLPVLLVLGILCVMPAPRVLPSRRVVSRRVVSSGTTSAYHGRPSVRVSASFDAARPRARPRTRDAAPAPIAPLPTIELREQALVAGEQPDVRDKPPAYDAAPAYEVRSSTDGAVAGMVETVEVGRGRVVRREGAVERDGTTPAVQSG
ncbi:hypothetical protein F503_00662 [Ophiostoma piceae UAMH 11346]|uniref:Uncharacterized protein n=1 Tax=Ophiostoma piceae (strain UAMH 11346) TaxID=1262450 RepID=S3BMF6_OPHP1|nr:hypothetical protein F503_00662 [Ophiostoma piceae UAMH 11346]